MMYKPEKLGLFAGCLFIAAFLAAPMLQAKIVSICADFSVFADDTPMKDDFIFVFQFHNVVSGNKLFINASGGELGLQFHKDGVDVTLPAPVASVLLRVGTFAGDVGLEVFDDAGKSIGKQTISTSKTYQDIPVSAGGIYKLAFRGGGNEASIANICVDCDF